jgi:hypothetical protein
MGIMEKIDYVVRNPKAVVDYYNLSRQLADNRKNGICNFLFQCDAKGHFPYLKPYYDALKDHNNVDIFITGADLDGELISFLQQKGVRKGRIIKYNSLVRLTEWDIYMSPTSWGNIFPKNDDCPRIQLFHTLADKNIQYGGNLLKFNVIFVCGPVHHEFLKRYLFDPFPNAMSQCRTFDVGYAKIDALINGNYDPKGLRKSLNIPEWDERKIVLYAPNWETTSALYKYKDLVFEVLRKTGFIVLIKLHYMSLLPQEITQSSTDVNWKSLLDRYRKEDNIRIIDDNSIDPYLSLSDLMITDYGGASFEFMCTGKPIVYLDCPEFFDMRGKDIMEYWSRDSGYLISDIEKLPETIDMALRGDASREHQQEELVRKLLYNPGAAAQAGISVVFDHLLARNPRI